VGVDRLSGVGAFRIIWTSPVSSAVYCSIPECYGGHIYLSARKVAAKWLLVFCP
jgi:hypothetical protein